MEELLRFPASSPDGAREVKGSTVWLARGSAWVSTVRISLTEQEVRGGQRHRWYANIRGTMLKLVMEQLLKNFSVFVQHWAGDEEAAEQNREMTHLIEIPSTNQRYLFMDGKRF